MMKKPKINLSQNMKLLTAITLDGRNLHKKVVSKWDALDKVRKRRFEVSAC